MRRKIVFVILLNVLFLNFSCKQRIKHQSNLDGYVPDKETAVKIAEAVWLSMYGDEIYDEKPFVAELKDNVWTVESTNNSGGHGGGASILIQKSDGKILSAWHEK